MTIRFAATIPHQVFERVRIAAQTGNLHGWEGVGAGDFRPTDARWAGCGHFMLAYDLGSVYLFLIASKHIHDAEEFSVAVHEDMRSALGRLLGSEVTIQISKPGDNFHTPIQGV